MSEHTQNDLLILTDSATDIPAELLKSRNIKVIPLNVFVDGKHYLDGINLSANEFYAGIAKSSEFPRTAPPTEEDFHNIFMEHIGTHDILGIFISSKMSQTLNVANRTKMKFYNRYLRERAAAPGKNKKFEIELIDSRLLSMGAGLLVLEAAEKAQAGWSVAEIKQHVEQMRAQVGIYLMVDNLDHLQRGGKIGRVAAFAGKLFDFKPLLGMENGLVVAKSKKIGAARAHKQLVEYVTADAGEIRDKRLRMVVCSAGARSKADAVTDMLKSTFPKSEMIVGDFGPGVGTYTGPGAIGVAFHIAS